MISLNIKTKENGTRMLNKFTTAYIELCIPSYASNYSWIHKIHGLKLINTTKHDQIFFPTIPIYMIIKFPKFHSSLNLNMQNWLGKLRRGYWHTSNNNLVLNILSCASVSYVFRFTIDVILHLWVSILNDIIHINLSIFKIGSSIILYFKDFVRQFVIL